MLPSYGVVVGQYTSYTTNQGQWLHVDLNISTGDRQYEAAVDVNEPNGLFQYQLLNNLDMSLFSPVSGFAPGWHQLSSTPASGAIDYARSPILQRPLGCLALFWGILNSIFGTNNQTWTNVTGNEAGDALVSMVTGSTKLFAFGAPYTTGYGVSSDRLGVILLKKMNAIAEIDEPAVVQPARQFLCKCWRDQRAGLGGE